MEKAGYGKTVRPVVCPEKACVFSGRKSRQGKSQSPVTWMARLRETKALKPIDNAILWMVSELPGYSESERVGGLESTELSGSRARDRRVKAVWTVESWLSTNNYSVLMGTPQSLGIVVV